MRERLFGQIDEMRASPAMWICAEPGAGKTALVSCYVEARNLPAIWYRVDGGDADLSAFFFHLKQAAADVSATAGDLPLLTPDYLPDADGFARRFFRAMFAALPQAAVVVLDNLEEAPALGAILRTLVQEIPAGMNVMLISRTRPLPALARLIGGGKLAVLDPAELTLTADESAAIASRHGVHDPDFAALLHRESEGWVVGLILLLAGGRQERDAQRAPKAVAREILFDYFATEIFLALPADARTLLTRLSLFPTFTAHMAQAICIEIDASAVLDELYRTRQFLTRNADGQGIYRLHDLFRRFLLEQFRTCVPAAQHAFLRGRAAALLRENGDLDAAIRLLAADQQWHAVAAILLEAGNALVLSGRWQTLEGWLAVLPAEVVAEDPWLTYWQGVSRSFTDPLTAKAMLTRAYEGFARQADRSGQYRCAISCIEVVVAQLSSYQELDDRISALEPLLSESVAASESEEMNGWYAFLYAALCRQPGNTLVARGVGWLTQRMLNANTGEIELLRAGVVLILYSCTAADHALARQVIARTQPLAGRGDLPPVTRWLWSFWLGYYYMWRIEYDRCAACWENCFAISERYQLHALDFLPQAAMAMVDLVQDRIGAAEQRLLKIRPSSPHGQEIAEGFYWLVETFRRVMRNQDDAVEQATENLLRSTRDAGLFPLHILAMTDVAALELLRGRNGQAERLVAQVKAMVSGTAIRLVEGQVHAIESTLAFRRGDRADAVTSLDKALSASQELGTCGCLLWLRPGFGALFSEALQVGLKSDYVQRLIRQYQIPAPSPLAGNWPWMIRVRSLGDLELLTGEGAPAWGPKAQRKVLDLLRLLVAGSPSHVSTSEVADALWPDAEGDAAQSNLRGTVKRLRELLGSAEAVRHHDGKLALNARLCWVDCRALEALATEIWQPETRRARTAREWEGVAFDLYRGPFLRSEMLPGVDARRRAERRRFARILGGLERAYEDEGVADCAGRLHLRALELDSDMGPYLAGRAG